MLPLAVLLHSFHGTRRLTVSPQIGTRDMTTLTIVGYQATLSQLTNLLPGLMSRFGEFGVNLRGQASSKTMLEMLRANAAPDKRADIGLLTLPLKEAKELETNPTPNDPILRRT